MKLFLSLSVLICLAHAQSIAQQPGAVHCALLTDPGPQGDTIYSFKVQPNGKVVTAGNSYRASYTVIAIGRFDGVTPDPSFGINGLVTTSLDSAHTVARALEIQQDGKIVVAGGYRKGAVDDFLLVRYKPDGSPDSSFGMHGIVRTDISSGSFDFATAIAIQTDGKIVAAGQSGSSLAVCRYDADGSADSSFDSDGKLLSMAVAGATSMMLQADGKIVVCSGGGVIRLNPDGSVDQGFGTNGVVALTNYFKGMAIQNDGKILLSGGTQQFVLERLDTAGVHDNSFGNGGVVTTAGFGNPDRGQAATSVCLQADGRILAAGYIKLGLIGDGRNFAVARYHATGALDSSFGQNGKAYRSIPGGYVSMSYSAAINHSNELVLAGANAHIVSFNSSEWALMCIYLGPMLAVPTAPGVDREITVAPNPAEDLARIQSTRIENGPWHLSLCDLTGRTVSSETVVVTNNALDKSISLLGLPAGVYVVALDNGIGRIRVKLAKSR